MRPIVRAVRGSSTPRLALATVASLVLMLAASAAGAAGRSPQPGSDRAARPVWTAQNGDILFARDGDIYLADAKGEKATALIHGQSTDAWPIWSRDGSHFMFERELATQPAVAAGAP